MNFKVKIPLLFLAFCCFRTITVSAQLQVNDPQTENISQNKLPSGPNNGLSQAFDQNPEPLLGGPGGFQKFLAQNIKYQLCTDASHQGTVYIEIFIDSNGNQTNARIKQDPIGYGCGEEALRVIKLIPKWSPAKMKGKPVNCSYLVPVKFVLH